MANKLVVDSITPTCGSFPIPNRLEPTRRAWAESSDNFRGVSEWITAALLMWGFWNKKAGALGAAISTATFITTITIIPFMPDGWDAAAGFPAMKGNVAFLMKDIVLLAVSFYLLKQDVVRAVFAAPEQGHNPLPDYTKTASYQH